VRDVCNASRFVVRNRDIMAREHNKVRAKGVSVCKSTKAAVNKASSMERKGNEMKRW